MSVVIAIRDKEGVIHMASDSMASNSFTDTRLDICKVNPTMDGNLLIGMVGELGLSELQYYEFLPKIMSETRNEKVRGALERANKEFQNNLGDYEFITQVKFELKEVIEIVTTHSPKNGERFDGELLIVFKDKMYLMSGDYSMIPIENDYYVIGSGQYHSTAVMKMLNWDEDTPPVDKLINAIKLTEEHVLSVGGKIYYVNSKDCEVNEIILGEKDLEEEDDE